MDVSCETLKTLQLCAKFTVLILVVMDVSCEGKIFNPSHYRHCTPIFSIFSTNGTKKWGEF